MSPSQSVWPRKPQKTQQPWITHLSKLRGGSGSPSEENEMQDVTDQTQEASRESMTSDDVSTSQQDTTWDLDSLSSPDYDYFPDPPTLPPQNEMQHVMEQTQEASTDAMTSDDVSTSTNTPTLQQQTERQEDVGVIPATQHEATTSDQMPTQQGEGLARLLRDVRCTECKARKLVCNKRKPMCNQCGLHEARRCVYHAWPPKKPEQVDWADPEAVEAYHEHKRKTSARYQATKRQSKG